MSKYRTFAIAAAAILIGVHVLVLAARYGTPAASLWGDVIGAAMAPLLTAIVAWSASYRSGPFGQPVWRLVSLSFLLAFLGGVSYTYYFDFHNSPPGTMWPSDILVFFWAVPAAMTIFLSPRDPDSGFRWLRLCDFVQVCTLVLALELSLLYVPSRWQAAGQAMEVRALNAGIIFFGLLALSFLARGLLTPFRTAHALFLRLSAFFFAFAITTNVTLYSFALGNYKQGTWLDLLWTISYCFMVGIAATWNDSERQVVRDVELPAPAIQLLAQFSPLLIPAIVFPLVLRIAQEQFLWSVFLVMTSFLAAGGRLFVVQNQLLVSAREVRKNLSLLQGIMEGTTDAVFVKDLHGRYMMINSAGAQLLGRAVKEVIGKQDTELFPPDSGREIMARDRKVVESGETQTCEEVGIFAGVARTYLSTKGPYRDSNGQIIGLLGLSRDITDRKWAEEEMRQSQQKLRIHFEHTPLAVIEWDTQLRITEWSPSAERVFGYSR